LGAFLICQGQKKLHTFYKLKGSKQYERSNNKETFTYYSSASRLTVSYLMCSMGDGNAQQSCREILNKILTAVVGFMLTSGFFVLESTRRGLNENRRSRRMYVEKLSPSDS